MPDSADVEDALIAKLRADTGAGGVLTLMPDGVWLDVGPANGTRYVIVSLVDHHDEPLLGGKTAFEDVLYLVKAVEKSAAGANAKAAAARIHTLLNRGSLTVAGYGLMVMRRVARVRFVEVDDVDKSLRVQHRGGRYQVMVAPST